MDYRIFFYFVILFGSCFRLHPSINEVDMRHSCLRALASAISWPTTFGQQPLGQDVGSILKGSANLTPNMIYLDLRQKIIRTLVFTLRNETETMNLQLALGLSHCFCDENARYDLNHLKQEEDDDGKTFAISAVKQIISAVCDNLCKQQWSSELGTCLAAFDCLNALSTIPANVLFHKGKAIILMTCTFETENFLV